MTRSRTKEADVRAISKHITNSVRPLARSEKMTDLCAHRYSRRQPGKKGQLIKSHWRLQNNGQAHHFFLAVSQNPLRSMTNAHAVKMRPEVYLFLYSCQKHNDKHLFTC